MNEVIKVAEQLYREANPETNMDVPSYAYEQVEASNKRRIAKKSNLKLYDWCKQEYRMKLKADYEKAVLAYVKAFETKQEMECGWWIADEIGGVCDCSDLMLSFDLIKTDIDLDAPKGLIIDYYDNSLEAYNEKRAFPNYKNYIDISSNNLKYMKLKNKIWYESNACWGWIKNINDLVEKYKLQTNPVNGVFKTINDFLNKSLQHKDGSLNFGTRIEHTGESLEAYLKKSNPALLSQFKKNNN